MLYNQHNIYYTVDHDKTMTGCNRERRLFKHSDPAEHHSENKD